METKSQNKDKKKKLRRCRSIMELMDALPLLIPPSRNISSCDCEPEEKVEKKCDENIKNVGVGPNFPVINNVDDKLIDLLSSKKPAKKSASAFDVKPVDKFMEQYPLLIQKTDSQQAWPEDVEDWSGSVTGTHMVVPLEPMFNY